MGAVFFYHLTHSSAEETLRMLLPKAQGAGWRVEVRGTDRAAMERLDAALWLVPEDGFLPHGMAGGPHDAQQPVILSWQGATPDCACIIALNGADITAEEAQSAERVCILFDGHDEPAVQHARSQWRNLTAAQIPAQYWAQEGGRWEKKAES